MEKTNGFNTCLWCKTKLVLYTYFIVLDSSAQIKNARHSPYTDKDAEVGETPADSRAMCLGLSQRSKHFPVLQVCRPSRPPLPYRSVGSGHMTTSFSVFKLLFLPSHSFPLFRSFFPPTHVDLTSSVVSITLSSPDLRFTHTSSLKCSRCTPDSSLLRCYQGNISSFFLGVD